MSLKTLPIIFLNLGGEMCYILDQRLQAQNVPKDKAARVMNDIVCTMFNVRLMEDLFQAQEQYNKKAMRGIFDKLAHVSVMRLSAPSMDKLYDLMVMAVKYQIQACISPKDVLVVIMNHMDGIRKYVQSSPNVQAQIDYAYKLLRNTYFHMTAYEMHVIRRCLLTFFQDSRIKISVLIKEKLQNDDGRFICSNRHVVPYGGCAPGTIRYYSHGKVSKTIKFDLDAAVGVEALKFVETLTEANLEKTCRHCQRGSDLGSNLYHNRKSDDKAESAWFKGGVGMAGGRESGAQQELSLLRHLLVQVPNANDEDNFTLNLFGDRELDESMADDSKKITNETSMEPIDKKNVIKVDASKRGENFSAAEQLVADLKLTDDQPSNKPKKSIGQDMLDLMDS